MLKRVRFRIYPNKKQQLFFNKTFGCCRLVYNKFLSLREDAHKLGERLSFVQTVKLLPKIKRYEGYKFLKDTIAIVLVKELVDLQRAYDNYLKKRTGAPRFKRKCGVQKFTICNQNDVVRIEGNYIRISKVGYVKIRQSMEIGKIHSATIVKTVTGKFFVTILFEFVPSYKCESSNAIGIDVGIKEYYTDSNGNKVHNPDYLEKKYKKLRREQRRLMRKKKGSKNYNKQRIILAKVHEKIENQRNDFLHKQSTKLVRENKTICIENLFVKGMLRNHKLAKRIMSASWSKFLGFLQYKAAWYGNTIIKVPRYYPSSQTCHCCGYVNPAVRNLQVRSWECPKCHSQHDRDLNASINILKKGLTLA